MDMDNHSRSSAKRLTKQPPPQNSKTSIMNQATHSSLHRQPSQSPASSQNSHDPQRTPTSSNSSLDRPGNPSSDPYPRHHQYARQSFEETVPDEFNPHPGTLSSLDSTKATGYPTSLRRPGPPPSSHTAPYGKAMSPSLRPSASFSSTDRSFDRVRSGSESGYSSSSKRYSDDANGVKAGKKKSMMSSFIGSVIGSPRPNPVKISAPENPVHVTHVGFDNQTGQFTVRIHSSTHVSNPYSIMSSRKWRPLTNGGPPLLLILPLPVLFPLVLDYFAGKKRLLSHLGATQGMAEVALGEWYHGYRTGAESSSHCRHHGILQRHRRRSSRRQRLAQIR